MYAISSSVLYSPTDRRSEPCATSCGSPSASSTWLGSSEPEVQALPLSEAVLQLLNRVYAFADNHRDRQLMAIAADGCIDEDEQPLFLQIVEHDLQEIIEAAMAVRYASGRHA